jgi:hypothetical protein
MDHIVGAPLRKLLVNLKSDIIISLILFGVSAGRVDLWVELGKFKNIISLPNFIVFPFPSFSHQKQLNPF